ncbi:MAG: carbohydrate kinase family protein [Thermomicrobium sp.]|nr:carbohydrate kinase family protein [Thermomicrobium sp.]MCS7246419.1 carbohydrate kinase family protein [Thermomicrobium sp.]MDW7981923.1 carbohydrate kinase family protein [Thermomicrobium sp.]
MDVGTASGRQPQVAVLGTTSWDQFLVLDRPLTEGSGAIVVDRLEASGGTAANLAVALARLGVPPLFVTTCGDDDLGRRLLDELHREGVLVHALPPRSGTPTDRCTILVTPGPERTILWTPGASLRLGDPLPLDRVFMCQIVVVDVEDAALRQRLVDLPAHVAPRVQLVGPLTHLVDLQPDRATWLALQHDVIVGSDEELRAVTGCDEFEAALTRLREMMPLGATRLAAITRGRAGCVLLTRRQEIRVPAFEVAAVDPTGAGDAFAAGIVYGLLTRRSLPEVGRFANAMGALATRAFGARTSLPTHHEITAFLQEARPCA